MINWLANPVRFLKFARYASPIFGGLALVCIAAATYLGLFNSPAEQYQGDSVRIMYIHAPAAWVSMMAYSIIAVASFISYIWRHPLADIGARACAIPGAAFTLLTLVTGSLWGSVTWMTWWEWDGRMTSYLVLLFIYLGYISIWAVIRDQKLAARIAGLVAMVGAINLPIIKFSVDWWDDTLHQKATVSSPGAPGMEASMLTPLFVMMIGFSALLAWMVINNVVSALAKQRKARAAQKSRGAAPNVSIETL